jgi:DNA (cytosine-5)-methyltransferase 1
MDAVRRHGRRIFLFNGVRCVADTVNILSLCSGVGMLDEGLRTGLEYLGFRSRLLGQCEREAYAASVLLARMEDASVEPSPVFCGDMRDLDARPLRPYCDIVVAGLPCQPYSCAGKQLGHADERSYGADDDGPLPQSLRIISECRPAVVFLENVPAWVRGGWFRRYGEELSRMGYAIQRPLFVTAASVGASHKRERVFILAIAGHWRIDQWPRPTRSVEGPGESIVALTGRDHDSLAESELAGSRGERISRAGSERRSEVVGAGEIVGNAEHGEARNRIARKQSVAEGQVGRRMRGVSDASGVLADAKRRNATRGVRVGIESPLAFAPGPSDGRWPEILTEHRQLAPAIKPGFRVLADGASLVVDDSRADQLRCGGNGCVPLAAAVAFIELIGQV